jgi:hypothetical protein
MYTSMWMLWRASLMAFANESKMPSSSHQRRLLPSHKDTPVLCISAKGTASTPSDEMRFKARRGLSRTRLRQNARAPKASEAPAAIPNASGRTMR